ncbi:MAG TPA: EAL domain-containing protein [Gemmatimonadaceae bacterium]|nr:EAL domain-containing protein [Gemmatimonadaceae bacterium]
MRNPSKMVPSGDWPPPSWREAPKVWGHVLAGALVGLFFPLCAWALDLWRYELPWTAASLAYLHYVNPLHWLADFGPVVLAAFGFQSGKWRHLQTVAREESDFIDSVLGTVDCLVLVLDTSGRILRLNRAAEMTTGVGEWEASGRTLWEQFLSEADAVAAQGVFDAASPLSLPYRAESPWHTVHGSSRLIAWSATAARGMAGQVQHVIVTGVDVTDRRRLEEQLAHRAFHDSLTDLANRALFRDRVSAALERASEDGPRVAVLFIDLDDFKDVNDSLGHGAGDRLLQAVAGRLLNATRGCDAVARLGGDEFAILLEGVREEREAVIVAERVSRAMRAPFAVDGTEASVGTSIGIAIANPTHTTDELLRDADVAMYLAKAGGKGRYALFVPGMQVETFDRLEMETDLRAAVQHEQLEVHYQPIVRLESGVMDGVEALARWNHPERGSIPPSEFIPLAEETGIIVPLGRLVLRTACRQARAWRDQHPAARTLTLTVNISARQFQDAGLVHDVRAALRESGFPAEQLVLEITESALIRDIPGTIATLHALKALGLRIAIDDFGTGYSSLGYLQRFPIDILKIDKSFVDAVGMGSDDPVLARTIIFLGDRLQMCTVAEGIEDARQIEGLRFLGCELGQGFHFSRPLPGAELAQLLARAGSGGAGASRLAGGAAS